jgi:hypothetical protein
MTPRDRRAVVLGGAVCLSALLLLRGVPWAVRAAASAVASLHARAELLARAEAELREAPVLVDSARVLQARITALAPRILVGDREAEVVTDMAGRLGVLAEQNRVRLGRTAAIADSLHAGPLHRISLRASVEGDARGTLGFAGGLARAPALLDLAELRIIAADPGSPPAAPEVLRSELTVRGWYLVRDSAP